MKFEEIYEEHYRNNFDILSKKLARRLGGRIELAEEALQDAYLKAWKYKSTFDSPADFNEWMGTVINNCVKDKKRDEFQKESIRVDVPEEIEIDISKAYVAQAIKSCSLSDGHKRILSLRFEKDMPVKDIPHFTDYSYMTCRIVISNFMKELSE